MREVSVVGKRTYGVLTRTWYCMNEISQTLWASQLIPVAAPPDVITQTEGDVRIDWNAPVIEPLLNKLKAEGELEV